MRMQSKQMRQYFTALNIKPQTKEWENFAKCVGDIQLVSQTEKLIRPKTI